MVPRNQKAFTLVELLVVMAIIGLLVSLLLPAVQAARHAARRSICQNHQRQVGLGLQNYHVAHQHFPPGGVEWRLGNDLSKRQIAWSAYLLPFVEEQSVYDRLDLDTAFDSLANAQAAATQIEVYLCPSSLRGNRLVDGRGPCDFGGIFGERITSPNHPPKGIMIYDRSFSMRQISDGVSKTLIVAEDSQFYDGQWINGRNLFDQAFPINAAPKWENDIRSEHRGGAHGTLADGSVRFLSEQIDLQVLAALCTRAADDQVHGSVSVR